MGTRLRCLAIGAAICCSILVKGWVASFDCTSSALTATERQICSDATLSNLDSALGAAYKTAKANTQDTARLVTEQRAWVGERNKCRDLPCLATAYATRISQLSNPDHSLPAAAPTAAVAVANPPPPPPERVVRDPPQPAAAAVPPPQDSHRWLNIDERDVGSDFGSYHMTTEVATDSVVKESADERVVLSRASTNGLGGPIKKITISAHYAISCSQNVFVVRDGSTTVIAADGTQQSASAAGTGKVNPIKFDSVEAKLQRFLCGA
jgi:uncharacterized protein